MFYGKQIRSLTNKLFINVIQWQSLPENNRRGESKLERERAVDDKGDSRAAGPTGPTGSTCSVAQAVTILDPSILSLPSRYSTAYLTRHLTQPDAGPVETRAVCYETCEVRKVWPDWRGSRGRRRACDAAVHRMVAPRLVSFEKNRSELRQCAV